MVEKVRSTVIVLVGVLIVACTTGAPAATTSSAPPVPTTTAAPSTPPTVASTPTDDPSPTGLASDPPTEAPSPSVPPSTTVTSDDGVLSVEIPDGALPDGVEVSIRSIPAEESPRELLDAGVMQDHYELLPSGTTFTAPVHVTRTYPRATFGATSTEFPILFQALRDDDGTWTWLDEPSMTVTGESIVLTGTTTHFSRTFVWSDRTSLNINPPAPRDDLVGTEWQRTVTLTSQDEREHAISLVSIEVTHMDPPILVDPGVVSDERNAYTHRWECVEVGPYVAAISAMVTDFARDNPFWGDTLGVAPVTGEVLLHLDGTCYSPSDTLPPTASPLVTLPPGVVDRVCIRVHHDELDAFLSYLDFLLWLSGTEVDVIDVVMLGANNDEPVVLEYDTELALWRGSLGLFSAGSKEVVAVTVHLTDGTDYDATAQVHELLGASSINVRPPPDEDGFGDCPPR